MENNNIENQGQFPQQSQNDTYAQQQPPQPQQPQPQYNQGYQGQVQYNQYQQSQYNSYAQPQSYKNPNGRTKMIAGLLGIFLGTFGVHDFYLGNKQKGTMKCIISGVCIALPMVILPYIISNVSLYDLAFISGVITFLVSFLPLGVLAMSIWGLVEGIFIMTSKPGIKWHKDAEGKELSDN